MGVANVGRTTYQWGLESTNGTAVAATERILLNEMTWSPIDTVDRTTLMREIMLRETGDEIVTQRGMDFSGTGPLLLDQFHTWLSMSVEGGVSAAGTTPDVHRTWTHDRVVSGVPNLDSYTLETRFRDGTNGISKETSYAMLRSWTLDWALDGPVSLSVDGFARRRVASIYTALSGANLIPGVEKALSGRTTVAIDDTFGGLGGTVLAGKVIGGSLTFFSGASPQRAMDNRTDDDFSLEVYSAEEMSCELSLRILCDPQTAANGDYGTELAKAEAVAIRAVQIFIEGSDIGGGTNRSLTLNMLMKHQAGTLAALGKENGQEIIEVDMVATTDGSSAWFSATTVNGRALVATGTPAS